MVVSLNIKNERTCTLVAELAELRGESQTSAVTHAVEEALRQARSAPKLERMRAISHEMAKVLKKGPSMAEMDALLYDDQGLPK